MKLKTLLVGAALASAFTSASALPVVNAGNNAQPNQSNLVRNPCDAGIGTNSGSPVFGCLNTDHAQPVSLSSDESLEIFGGQARLEGTVDFFSTLTITTLSPLSSVILNIHASEDGFVTFTDGAGTSGEFALSNNGQNFFTITGITGNSLTFHTFLVSGGAETDIVDDVRQIRLAQVGAIPEPETYALMMAGLAAIGFIARRRKMPR